MADISAQTKSDAMAIQGHWSGVVLRSLVIGLMAFLTVVDLFATQAILPSLTRHYNVSPAAMGFAVNASTMGMAVAGLVVGVLSPHIDRRLGILLSLVLLAIPTALLASAEPSRDTSASYSFAAVLTGGPTLVTVHAPAAASSAPPALAVPGVGATRRAT